jgi:small-conductance mechanosensitive channel
MTTPDWLYHTLFGNTLRAWTVAFGSAVLTTAVILVLRAVIVRRLAAYTARTTTFVDDLILQLVRSLLAFYVAAIALCVAGLSLHFGAQVHRLLRDATIVFALLQTARSGTQVLSLWLDHYAARRGDLDQTTVYAMGIAAKIIVWIALLLIGLENVGFKINSLLTTLGVGGVVIALALQNIFSDLFAAMSIVLDKPFVVGENIAVDTFEGTVEHIGLKSTRITSVNGEQVVFANTDLLKSRVRNLSRRQGRRLVFTLSIDPKAKADQLARVPHIMADVVASEKRATFIRSHLMCVGVRGFEIETAIQISHPEYIAALDARQAVLLEFLSCLEREGIALAPPEV